MAANSDRTRRVLGGLGLAYGLSGVVFGLGAAQERLGAVGPGLLVVCGLATGGCYLMVLLGRRPVWSPARRTRRHEAGVLAPTTRART